MKSVAVVKTRSTSRACPIYAGHGILRGLPALMTRRFKTRRAVVVTDARLERGFGGEAARRLRAAGWEVRIQALPGGEKAKSFGVLLKLYGFLLRSGAGRTTPVVAVGGGSIGDAAGFAAATFMRGVPLVHVPTTLLAQVDSSIGGKTGVDHPLAKNAVGVFHQPAFVLADTRALRTLPGRELLSGLAEAVKYALVFDPAFGRRLLRSWNGLLAGEPAALMETVAACARWKARVVSEDELDLSGRRELLNFGHTLGHALEAAGGWRLRHGSAVAWGMRAAVALSEGRGWLSAGERRLARDLLRRLPAVPARGLRWRDVHPFLKRDKKAREGRNVFILLRGLGRPVRVDDVTPRDLRRAVAEAGIPL